MEDDIIEEMTEKKASYHIMWTAADTPDMKKGKIYKVVAEWYNGMTHLED